MVASPDVKRLPGRYIAKTLSLEIACEQSLPVVAHILQNEGDHWVQLDLPAIADEPQKIALGNGRFHTREIGDVLHPEREPLDLLMRQKASMGSPAFSAQYQQRPVPEEGNLVNAEWLHSYDVLPEKQPLDQVVQSRDCTTKSGELNDYSACLTFFIHKDTFYLIDVLRQRVNYPELKKLVLAQKAKFGADVVLMEDTGHGTALVQDLKASGLHAIPIRPDKDKVTRMNAQSAKLESGQCLLPAQAVWLEDFKSELLVLPQDAMTTKSTPSRSFSAGPTVGRASRAGRCLSS